MIGMRFLRSIRQRYWIWKSQNGFCAICQEPLGSRFHIDHVKAWARGGKTVRENLQATCARCNIEKGSKMALFHMNRPNGDKRPETLECIELVVSRWRAGETSTAAMFPPRWGKNTIVRGGALELHHAGAPTSVVLVPWEMLAEQVKDLDDIRDMYRRYGIRHDVEFTVKRVQALQTDQWWSLTDGVPTLISMTLALAYRNKDAFLDGIRLLHRRSGVRIPVFADESHLLKLGKNWGPFALEIIAAGGYLIPLTGTPVPGMPGFEDDVDWADKTQTIKVCEVVDGEEKWFNKTYEGRGGKVEVNADIQVTWKRAWDVGALTRVNGVWLDFEVTDKTSGEVIGDLSKLTKDQLSGNMRDILESPECVDKGARLFVERLLARKRKNKKAQGLVVTGFDYESDGNNGRNHHARVLKAAIEDYLSKSKWSGPIRIEIATGVTADGEPDNDSAKKILDYRKGKIDILIVKMMGLVGLDVPSLKTMLYLGIPRKGPLALQALSRVLTFWAEMEGIAADIIAPKEATMVELWERMIGNQGGQATSEMVLTDSVETTPPDEKPETDYGISNGRVDGYTDEEGRLFDGDREVLLQVIKEKYITRNLTDPEILSNYENGGYTVSEAETEAYKARNMNGFTAIRDFDADLPGLKGAFGTKAKKIVNKRIRYNPDNPTAYRAALEKVQGKAKELCRFRGDVPKLDDAALLKKLIDALDQAERIVFGNG